MNSTLESENATLDVDVSEPKRFGRFVRSLYTFNASKPGHSPSDLTFRRGDIVEHLGPSSHGAEWSCGRVVATVVGSARDGVVQGVQGDRTQFVRGDFPDTYVERMDTAAVCMADFDYPAKGTDGKKGKREKGHLRIRKKDVISIISGPELGLPWWLGFNRNTKKKGEFPANYATPTELSWDVEPEEADPAEAKTMGGDGGTDAISFSKAKRKHHYDEDGKEVSACDGVHMCASSPADCAIA